MRQQSEQSEQEDLTNLFQNSDPPQDQPLYPPISQISDIQQPNPSETTTIHDPSEISDETVQNTRSFTTTDDSNILLIPTHNITQNEFNNQNQDNTFTTNPEMTSVLSTSNTNITQPSQTQVPSPEIIIHLLFHLSSQLKQTPIILLNKAHQIHTILHRKLIQYIFKHQPHHHLLKYKLQLILQLKLTQCQLHNLH